MLNRNHILLALGLMGMTSCHLVQRGDIVNFGEKRVLRDLDAIRESGKLVALTGYNSTGYYIYKGRTMGYEYELLKHFARSLGVELEVKVVHEMDKVMEMLNNGEGDLIAHNMTVTKKRAEMVDFTSYIYLTHQVLIQRNSEDPEADESGMIEDPIHLIGKDVFVRRNSAYADRLYHLSDELGGPIRIKEMPGHISTEELITYVADGIIDYTVADENVARLNQLFYDNIDVSVQLSFSQQIAWAVRKNAPVLRDTLNNWIEDFRESRRYARIYDKYFSNQYNAKLRRESPFSSVNEGRISDYDPLIQQYSDEVGLDWRLVASLVYQESHFDPNARSWMGAKGLMQLMPATFRKFGTYDPYDPEQNIKAGTRYLSWLDKFWMDSIPNDYQRQFFVIASYNAGHGHILDARRLAEKYGFDKNTWFGSVEKFIIKKSLPEYFRDEVVKYGYCRGTETHNYVSSIRNRYKEYVNFIPLSSDSLQAAL